VNLGESIDPETAFKIKRKHKKQSPNRDSSNPKRKKNISQAIPLLISRNESSFTESKREPTANRN